MIEVSGGIPWKGGGEGGAGRLSAWTATRDKRSSQAGPGGAGGGRVRHPPLPTPPAEGSAGVFASEPETRGEEGLYCSHVLAR